MNNAANGNALSPPRAQVINRVVQQRGDGRVLVGAMLQDQPGHGQQMRDVGDRRAFANLVDM
jgi:hypothetical protein